MKPDVKTMLATFTRDVSEWAVRGFPVVDAKEFKQRADICAACPKWNPEGYAGAGRCKECGCAGVKLYLRTTSCPLSKWQGVQPPDTE